MKDLIQPLMQASVRNQLETFGKGIVSYIPFKFAFQNLPNTAFCQKLPTAYFSYRLKFLSGFEGWRIFAPVVHFCTNPLRNKINSKNLAAHLCPNPLAIMSARFNQEIIR